MVKEVPVDPVRIRMGGIRRIIINRDCPADESFSSEPADGIQGYGGACFIRRAVHRVLNAGVMEGNEVIVTIEMRLPDDLQDPAFRQAGRPPARRGTAPGGKDPGHIEGKDEKDGASNRFLQMILLRITCVSPRQSVRPRMTQMTTAVEWASFDLRGEAHHRLKRNADTIPRCPPITARVDFSR